MAMMETERSGWVQEKIKKTESTDWDNLRSGEGTGFLKGPEPVRCTTEVLPHIKLNLLSQTGVGTNSNFISTC